MGEGARPELKLAAVCREGGGCIFGHPSPGPLSCRHPFYNQLVRVAVFPAIPFFILPSVFNKPVSGINVHLSRIMAEKLHFKPRYIVLPGGTYFPRNNSFGPGSYRRVR